MIFGWIGEISILKAKVLESALIVISDLEYFLYFVIFKFEGGLACPVLNLTQDLQSQKRVFNRTSVPANGFIVDLSLAHVAPILDLYEVDVGYIATNLQNYKLILL